MQAQFSVAAARNKGKTSTTTNVEDDGAEAFGSLNLEEVARKTRAEKLAFDNFWGGIRIGVNARHHCRKNIDKASNRLAEGLIKHKWLIDPNHILKVLWDLFLLSLVVYSVVSVTYLIGFNISTTEEINGVDDTITALFGVDIIMNFNTKFIDPATEKWVYDRKRIAQEYTKFWLWIDLVATIPFSSIVGAFIESSQFALIRVIRILRLVRLVKILKYQGNKEKHVEATIISPGLVSLIVLIGQIFLVAHIYACFWHFLALPAAVGSFRETWVTALGYETASVVERYIASLYYIIVTMLTIGYGDIHAYNEAERIYAIVTMLTGGVIFGALVSQVTALIDKRNPQAKKYKQNIDRLKTFLEEANIPKVLKLKAKRAYSYYLRKKSSFGESSIFEELPAVMQADLIAEIYFAEIQAIKLLSSNFEKHRTFVTTIAAQCRPFEAFRNDIIFEEGDICNHIVFVKFGTVRLLVRSRFNSSHDPIENGLIGYVKAQGYFGDAELVKNTTSVVTYQACSHCHLLAISHGAFNKALNEDAELCAFMKAEMVQRHERLIDVLRKLSKFKLSNENFPANKRLSRASHWHHGDINMSLSSPKRAYIWVDGDVKDPKGTVFDSINPKAGLDKLNDVKIRVVCSDNVGPYVFEEDMSVIAQNYLLDPTGQYKVFWDFLIGMFIIYSVLTVPIAIAFNQPLYDGSEVVDQVVNGFFLADIILSFNTCYQHEGADALVISRNMIASYYFKSWFWIDLLSTVPFDAIVSAVSTGNASLGFTQLIKIIRLMRLLKMARILKLGTYLEIVEDQLGISPALFHLVTLLMQVYFIAHWAACAWWGLSTIFPADWKWYLNTGEDGFVYGRLTDVPMVHQYLVSIYYTFTTMTTVGYGDIYPVNSFERVTAIILVLLAGSIFGYMIANVSAAVNTLRSSGGAATEHITEVVEFLREKKASRAVITRIISHVERKARENLSDEQAGILECLPPRMHAEVLCGVYDLRMSNIAILKHIPTQTVKVYLFNKLQPLYLQANEYIYKQGDPSSQVFFIVSGEARAFKKMNPKAAEMCRTELPKERRSSLQVVKAAMSSTMQSLTESTKGNRSKPDQTTNSSTTSGDAIPLSPQFFTRRSSAKVRDAVDFGTVAAINSDEAIVATTHSINVENQSSFVLSETAKELLPDELDEVAHGGVVKSTVTQPELPESSYQERPPLASLRASTFQKFHSSPQLVGSYSKMAMTADISRSSHGVSPTLVRSGLNFGAVSRGLLQDSQLEIEQKTEAHHLAIFKQDSDQYARQDSDISNLDYIISQRLKTRSSVGESFFSFRRNSRLDTTSTLNNSAHGGKYATVQGDSIKISLPANELSKRSGKQYVLKVKDHEQLSVKEDHDNLFNGVKKKALKDMTEADFIRNNLLLVGNVSAGDFVGHVAFLEGGSHETYLKTTMPTTVYTLSRSDMVAMINNEPSVALQLQAALITAVQEQARDTGHLHFKQNQIAFVKILKSKHVRSLVTKGAKSRNASSIQSISKSAKPIRTGKNSRWKSKRKLEKLLKVRRLMYDSDEEVEERKNRRNGLTRLMFLTMMGRQSKSKTSDQSHRLVRIRSFHDGIDMKHFRHKLREQETKQVNEIDTTQDNENDGNISLRRHHSFPSWNNRDWRKQYMQQGLV